MASVISLLIPSLTSHLSSFAFALVDFLSLAFVVALALYGFCWVSFDIINACIDLTEIPILMADLYVMIGAVFMDLDEVLDDEPTTYYPAVSLWITSVLAFVLWALPDCVVDVEPDRFLAQFDIVYYNDPYVLHSWFFLSISSLFPLLCLSHISKLLTNQPLLLIYS